MIQYNYYNDIKNYYWLEARRRQLIAYTALYFMNTVLLIRPNKNIAWCGVKLLLLKVYDYTYCLLNADK